MRGLPKKLQEYRRRWFHAGKQQAWQQLRRSSWWDKLLGKIGDAIVDGLLGAINAVLKLIFKLFTTILGWIIWLVA